MLPSHLECSRDASHRYSAAELATVCPQDEAPLLVRYGAEFMPLDLCQGRECTMWRYREMLPIDTLEEPISLGEGATPLLR
ncbi:MAG: threonine synthase, partial [Candidatus Eremiobacteraeota bacterium]|nr:threonine synthase [Candidatus Eremiobacteraeota bacterium]